MKKIAIPSRNEQVDAHFGHCEYYSIYTISDDNKIMDMEFYKAPQGCGCKSNVASVLADKEVSLMLAGNMGMGAVNVLQSHDIEVLRGCEGKVSEIIQQYLDGELHDNGESCMQHGEGHQCNH